ncbi:MAG: BMFP domain-containing protein YqiC [Oceanicoccus sp.]|jgi:BMFP domain-containing protein YqiC
MTKQSDLIDKLTDKLSGLLGAATSGGLKEDAQRNIKVLLQSAFSNLDMVSREEFDAQVTVLQRSREKIDNLEKQLQHLSEQLTKP